MKKIINFFLGPKVKNVRVIPLSAKIVFIFSIFLLVSNFSTNYINLSLNQNLLKKYLKTILLKDLKEIVQIANNQYEVFSYTENLEEAKKSLKESVKKAFPVEFSLIIGMKESDLGAEELVFSTKDDFFLTEEFLNDIDFATFDADSINEVTFNYNGVPYFGIYRYHKNFDMFLIRAEQEESYESETVFLSYLISVIIIAITILCSLLGFFFINRLTKYLTIIRNSLIEMQKEQALRPIDLKKATNDEVTYLGIALNSLSYTMKNLLEVFRKFVSTDLVQKAYEERIIRLEGERKELAILFTDIKKFTYITEKLGNDVIKLLNLFYDKAIESVIKKNGIIGSIIGDALLGIFGAFNKSEANLGKQNQENKSYEAVLAGFKIINDANQLRGMMIKKKQDLMAKNSKEWTDENEEIFKAVMLDVGIGIDGGEVFYGNIGSNQQMTNTVIGDNVNSASRLEGLTREYLVPIICSEYIKNEIEKIINIDISFIEIDRVQVKGKTEGKLIFYPILQKEITSELAKSVNSYKSALDLYYQGKWPSAHKIFKNLNSFGPAKVMTSRTRKRCPANWEGSWQMTSK